MNILFEKIYKLSPIFAQNMIISAYGRKLLRQRYGSEYKAFLNLFLSRISNSLESERELQLGELNRLVEHARKNSPFYSDLYAGLSTTELREVQDLTRFPIVDKEMLRERIEDVYTVALGESVSAFTGGTTGKSLVVRYTKEDFQKRMAYLDAFKIRSGVNPSRDRKATFSGRSFSHGVFQRGSKIYWRTNAPYNQRLYSTFDIDGNEAAYLRNLNDYKPDIINGFVSSIYDIAKFIVDSGERMSFIPKAIFTTSETLLPFHREVIERAFGARVFNQYASAEGAPFITECAKGSLHFNMDTGIIEVIDFGGGNGEEMVVTSFTSYGTPLIRYRIGDKLRFCDEPCSCGSCHPVVECLEGRAVDYLTSPTRGRVSLSHLADVVKGIPNSVKAMQFIQEDSDRLRVLLVIDARMDDGSCDSRITTSLKYRFGEEMKIELVRVDQIPREKSGKFCLIKGRSAGAGLGT